MPMVAKNALQITKPSKTSIEYEKVVDKISTYIPLSLPLQSIAGSESVGHNDQKQHFASYD